MARLTATDYGRYTPGTLTAQPDVPTAVSARGWVLAAVHAYTFFGTTIYVGVLWALHFFWYPTWSVFTVNVYYDQFIPPTSAATKFFTIVVPIMFATLVTMVWTERKSPQKYVAWLALLCLAGATYVGQMHIIPVNKILATHITDPARLSSLLRQWMTLNDIRMAIMTVMWLTMMWYFLAKGNVLAALSRKAA